MKGAFLSVVEPLFAGFRTASCLHLQLERATGGTSVDVPKSATSYPSRFASSHDAEKLGNFQDIRYTTQILVNGKPFTVAVDTGSSDLWVSTPNLDRDLGSFNNTQYNLFLGYGDGTYGADGTIGVAPVSLGAYTIEKQAFLAATKVNISSLLEAGIHGVLGLAFDRERVSHINDFVKANDGDSATWGHTFLHNIFDQYPDEPNLIAIDLARSNDTEDTVGGSLFIGEYDPAYSAVEHAPKLPLFPEGHFRWTVLLEGIYVDGKAVPLQSSVKGVPSGHLQSALDTGTPYWNFPDAVRQGIYSKIPGSKYLEESKIWAIPCNSTSIVELAFGGQKFPVHPLDLSTISKPFTVSDGRTAVTCLSSMVATKSDFDASSEGYEVLLGDAFLRNVYSVYDFGDEAAGIQPYVQLLSQITPEKAKSQVSTIRSKTMASLPPDIYSLDDSSNPLDPEGSKGTASRLVADESDDDSWKKYGLAAIILLVATLVAVLVILVFSILNFMKKGAHSSRRDTYTSAGGKYVDVKVKEERGYLLS